MDAVVEARLLDVVALRPFVPAKDFEASYRFYVDLGFTAARYADALAAMDLGGFGFLLQGYQAEGFAEHYMMQMVVENLDGWWRRIEALDLGARYGVEAPRAPAMQPWGMRVAYVFDPGGVLWQFTEVPVS